MTPPPLPAAFLRLPVAHRALHDARAGRPENSLAAVRAAAQAGYAIEIDLQPSSDGVAMVFHDDILDRLTDQSGPVKARSAADLGGIALLGSDQTIPTFAAVLAEVAGRVPLLVELKDQDGALGPQLSGLEEAAAAAVAGYEGPLAFMSFNPHSVARMALLTPEIPRGITTCGYNGPYFERIPAARRDTLRAIADFDRVGASFVSHEAGDLANPAITALKARGLPVLSWTLRSAKAEAEARRISDNVTFEGYLAALPA